MRISGNLRDLVVFVFKAANGDEPESFTQHALLVPTAVRTQCGFDLNSLPYEDPDHPEDGRTWYTDHDRDDVVACKECVKRLSEVHALEFELRVWMAHAADDLERGARDSGRPIGQRNNPVLEFWRILEG